MRAFTPKSAIGLTLIEVLIALAIVGIALTAVIKATSQNIRSTQHLQNKTLALWTGQTILNEARVGVLKLRVGDETRKEKIVILGKEFYWTANKADTPNKRIKKVSVEVFEHEETAEDESPIISLETYLYEDAHD